MATATRYVGEWANFAMNRKIWAYTQDQMPTRHPIAADIPDVAAAKTNFDGITYAKGASVLKQLVAWVGEDAFYEGTRRYFQKHQFGATCLHDLLEALEEASGQELETWKSAWLDTSGPSTLFATRAIDGAGAISDFTLHQSAQACGGVLRPHRVTVSTWRVAGGKLEQTRVFDVRIEGERTLIDPDGVLSGSGSAALVDLVVVNDDDLTYAIARLDERSTDVALAYVATPPSTRRSRERLSGRRCGMRCVTGCSIRAASSMPSLPPFPRKGNPLSATVSSCSSRKPCRRSCPDERASESTTA